MPLTLRQLKTLRSKPVGETRNRLADAIELSELSQADLSREIDMPQQYVSDVARGRYQTITVENAHKFAALFGCDIKDLFPAVTEPAETRA